MSPGEQGLYHFRQKIINLLRRTANEPGRISGCANVMAGQAEVFVGRETIEKIVRRSALFHRTR